MPKTFYLDGAFINAALRQTAYTSPAASYVALYVTSPTPSGGGLEVASLGGYGRQTVVWTAPVNGFSTNTADVIFPVATASWGTIVAFGLLDAPTGGNLLYYSPMNAPVPIGINDQLKFPAGQLQVSEA